MKRIVFVSLFIFAIAVAIILTAGLAFYKKENGKDVFFPSPPAESSAAFQSSGSGKIENSKTGQAGVLSSKEVAKHNSSGDCWLIIDGKVYDVSSYIDYHPGGPEAIIPYCGKDATRAFQTKDREESRNHSSRAYNLLKNYYVGDLNRQTANN